MRRVKAGKLAILARHEGNGARLRVRDLEVGSNEGPLFEVEETIDVGKITGEIELVDLGHRGKGHAVREQDRPRFDGGAQRRFPSSRGYS